MDKVARIVPATHPGLDMRYHTLVFFINHAWVCSCGMGGTEFSEVPSLREDG